MKTLYQLLFLVGVATAIVGAVLWAGEGFPFAFGELFSLIEGKARQFNKDSSFFLMVLGLVLAGYCAFELHHKRWKK